MACPGALSLLAPGGRIVLADCFRSAGCKRSAARASVGGGNGISAFRRAVGDLDLEVLAEADMIEAVGPSVDVEQDLNNVIGHAITRLDADLQDTHPARRCTGCCD